MIGVDLARAFDQVLLARDCGIEPDPWQADLLRSDAKRVLMCCSRQSGKTTVAVLLALHTALYTSASLSLIVSPSQRQSSEVFRTWLQLYHRLHNVPPLAQESALRCQLANGSRVLALPGSERTTRGYAGADLVVIDEAARIDDALLAALRPTMATKNDARLVALSTPFGKRGWFHDAWHGDESWHRVRVPASECPRISAEFLAEELRELGAQRYAEEYDLAWLDPTESVFPASIIDAAFSDQVSPLWA